MSSSPWNSKLISTLTPFPFLITSWACGSGNLEGSSSHFHSSLPSTSEGGKPRLVPRYLFPELRSRIKMVTCLMAGKQHSHSVIAWGFYWLSTAFVNMQSPHRKARVFWASGQLHHTHVHSWGPVVGKLCSHSATLMIHVPITPCERGRITDLLLLLLHPLSHGARNHGGPFLSSWGSKGSKGSGKDSSLSCFPNTSWLQESLEEKN